MFTRVLCAVVALAAMLTWTGESRAAHDSGETVELKGASADGRFVLMRIADVQRQYVDWLLSDVDGEKSVRRRFEGDRGGDAESGFVTALKRTHRLGRAPRARMKHPKRLVEGRFYTWVGKDKTLHRSFALVGRLGQRVEPSVSVRCFKEEASQCPAATQTWPDSSQGHVHWFRTGVYLVVDTWSVKDTSGDESRAIVVHRRLPLRPQRPQAPPSHLLQAPKGTDTQDE